MTYVPADVIGAYLAMSGVIAQSAATTPAWLSWAVFLGLLLLTPFYVCYLKTSPPGLQTSKIFHWSTSCIAFTAWVFAMGGPFLQTHWYQPVYGSIVLVFVTLIIPVLERRFVKDPGGASGPPAGVNNSDKAQSGLEKDKKDDASPPGK
ncbi:MAG: hypothetical protein JSS83_29245 [Cyanobacteria bacterium SZAS LIN-3]|nr:hypothetical protein [Cyanobacteria bacterium SZAS LIN-3]